MNILLSQMSLLDLENIKNILSTDFDDFWNYNILKQELLNLNSMYIIAKDGEKVVGFGGIWENIEDIHITNIVVKKDLRNLGIGGLILEKLIDIANSKSKNLTLEVSENNISAIKLYEKYKFKNLGIRKNYYNNTDDAIIMTLEMYDLYQ